MTLRNWDQVQANVKELSMFDAFSIRAFIVRQKLHKDNEAMSTLLKDLEQHIFDMGGKDYAEENCS